MRTIAIFCHGQQGDILTISSVLKYRKELWGDARVVWYIDDANRDLLAYQDIELRTFPRGFGYPEMVIEENRKLVEQGKAPIWEDWQPLVDENNHLNIELAKSFPSLQGITEGFFPAPHQVPVEKRHNVTYPEVSKRVFGVNPLYEWHPYICFSDEECDMVDEFMSGITGKNILFETFAGSGQSLLDEEMIRTAMGICRNVWPDCNFIFASHKFLRNKEAFPDGFFEQNGVYSCAKFTVRQCALVAEKCHLMISVSSGITVAASCWWGNEDMPILQFTGSSICGTKALALGKIVQVFADDRTIQSAKQEFYNELTNLLNTHK